MTNLNLKVNGYRAMFFTRKAKAIALAKKTKIKKGYIPKMYGQKGIYFVLSNKK